MATQLVELPFNIDLSDKVVVITGAAGVLCSDWARVISQCGGKVALLDLDIDKAIKLRDELTAYNPNVIAVKTNVLDKQGLAQAKAIVNKQLGWCDILINGAGGNNPRGTTSFEYANIEDISNPDIVSFFDLDPDGIRFVFDLNLIGTLLPTQVFATDMMGKDGSQILNVSSMNAFRPLTKIPAYSAAKAAVSNFTMWLAVHFAKERIRVNAIAPGFFVTQQNYSLLFDKDDKPTPRAAKILDHTPMARFGEPQDLRGTLLWLLSDKASGFVNGTVIPVDGGFSAYSGV